MLLAGCVSDQWVDRTLLKPVEAVTSKRERSTDYYENGQKKYERTWKGRDLTDQLLGGTRTGRRSN